MRRSRLYSIRRCNERLRPRSLSRSRSLRKNAPSSVPAAASLADPASCPEMPPSASRRCSAAGALADPASCPGAAICMECVSCPGTAASADRSRRTLSGVAAEPAAACGAPLPPARVGCRVASGASGASDAADVADARGSWSGCSRDCGVRSCGGSVSAAVWGFRSGSFIGCGFQTKIRIFAFRPPKKSGTERFRPGFGARSPSRAT